MVHLGNMDKLPTTLDMNTSYLATCGIPEEATKDINSSVLESGLWKIVHAIDGKNWADDLAAYQQAHVLCHFGAFVVTSDLEIAMKKVHQVVRVHVAD